MENLCNYSPSATNGIMLQQIERFWSYTDIQGLSLLWIEIDSVIRMKCWFFEQLK